MNRKQENKPLTEKDICVVIATYNRNEDLDGTLRVMHKEKNSPGRILVVDQSKDDKTKQVVNKHKKNLPVRYIHLKQPSSSMAKNRGINEAKKKYPIILILDDDVDMLRGFLANIAKIFNDNPKIMALGGVDPNPPVLNKNSTLSNLVFKIFFLPANEHAKYKITGPYGVSSDPKVKGEIKDAQWLNGFNMAFRSEIFKNYKMPESKGYNVLEDIDSSYYIFRKYGSGSLLITPKCRVHHRFSGTARYAERKRIFVNHEDHMYFYYQYFNNFSGTLKMAWSLTGIVAGNVLRYIFKPNAENRSALKYNLQAISYSIKNRKDIRKGKLRRFLNDDLSMKI